MPVFSYTAMNATTGEEVVGAIEADTQSKAVEALKAQMLFPTSLKRTDASASGTAESDSPEPEGIPEGRRLDKGQIPCSLLEGGFPVDGSVNLLGEEGRLYLVFDRSPSPDCYVKILFSDIEFVRRVGFLRKTLIVRLHDSRDYEFRGNTREIEKLCRLGSSLHRRKGNG